MNIVIWVFLILAGIILGRGAHKDDPWVYFLTFVLIFVGFWFAIEADQEGYKRGQIDALQGEYKYEMKIKKDTVWVETYE